MRIDLPTLYAVAAFATAVSGLMLLASWLQNRNATTLAWWGGGTLVQVTGGVLIALHGSVPDTAAIVGGNALWLAALGMMWCGARAFEGRRPRLGAALLGAIVWVALCQSEAFYGTPVLRIRVFATIGLVYALLIPWEYWRGRPPRPVSRWAVIALMLVQALLYLLRLPLAERLVYPVVSEDAGVLISLGVGALLLHGVCMAFLVITMVKERLELQLRHDALVDPLTGIANRRAFVEHGERLLTRAAGEGCSTALLMIDLDLFKRINDTLGHDAGDAVLRFFCTTTDGLLRPTDLFARTGGEEFACLLPGASILEAVQVADRIRVRFAAQSRRHGFKDGLTVSIGAATTLTSGRRLTALMGNADRALYAAKANGRNRVEWSPDEESALVALRRRSRIAAGPGDTADDRPDGATAHRTPAQAAERRTRGSAAPAS
ncbi:GGDEF domain-containing protein [Rhodoplanes sp. TEM]|uniref:diguanylate cyclase n=1 Tax=Rhodoplanes tepidamans TaxID=200616 RepID=A0ABT5J9J3_RHOTP|nr:MULTISPECIES: GGDEF domain-containing protein [Rhodoplanes]MDC7785959.1 GGDEF domain-containing protein [Rhodoplanes tepidamans]MDC7988017.1 GGDEF domain-containing protein [Rhodoplanes sp. TEM]MDQ0355422.1 diguanylate cyclase (GGDEF)-like protein [Rhodoplanes tepidamans]